LNVVLRSFDFAAGPMKQGSHCPEKCQFLQAK